MPRSSFGSNELSGLTATPPGKVGQKEHVQPRQQHEGQRQQRRIGNPGRWHSAAALCQSNEIGDNGRREYNGQPTMSLPDQLVPVHRDPLEVR